MKLKLPLLKQRQPPHLITSLSVHPPPAALISTLLLWTTMAASQAYLPRHNQPHHQLSMRVSYYNYRKPPPSYNKQNFKSKHKMKKFPVFPTSSALKKWSCLKPCLVPRNKNLQFKSWHTCLLPVKLIMEL